jgi:hypothetical protein
MVFLSKVFFANFKSANHVRFLQELKTLDPEEPFITPLLPVSQCSFIIPNAALLCAAWPSHPLMATVLRWAFPGVSVSSPPRRRFSFLNFAQRSKGSLTSINLEATRPRAAAMRRNEGQTCS